MDMADPKQRWRTVLKFAAGFLGSAVVLGSVVMTVAVITTVLSATCGGPLGSHWYEIDWRGGRKSATPALPGSAPTMGT